MSRVSNPLPLTIRLDPKQLRRIQTELKQMPGGVRRVLRTSISRTLTTGRTKISRAVRDQLNLRLATVNKRIIVHRPRGGADAPGGRIEIEASTPTLMSFGAKEKRSRGRGARTGRPRGVQVQILKREPPKLIREAFIRTGRGAQPQVFVRERGVISRVSGRERLKVLFGPSPAGVLRGSGERRLKVVTRDLHNVFERNVTSQVDRLLQRRKS